MPHRLTCHFVVVTAVRGVPQSKGGSSDTVLLFARREIPKLEEVVCHNMSIIQSYIHFCPFSQEYKYISSCLNHISYGESTSSFGYSAFDNMY